MFGPKERSHGTMCPHGMDKWDGSHRTGHMGLSHGMGHKGWSHGMVTWDVSHGIVTWNGHMG